MIPVNEPLLNGNEKKYLNECIDTGWISTEGPFVERFEQQFAKRMGRKFGIAVTNGTSAIDAAVEALGIGGPYPALVFSGLFTLRRRRRDCLQKIFCRRFVAKSHVRTALIIIDPPSLNQALCLGEALGIGDESARFYGGIVIN